MTSKTLTTSQNLLNGCDTGSGSLPLVGLFRLSVAQARFCREPSRKKQAVMGFTLIELLIALVVAAILFSVGVPSFQSAVRNMRLSSQTNDLIADLQYARSEAQKRSGTVVVCTAIDASGCTVGDWRFGRLVFFDANANGALDIGAGSSDETLRFRERSESNFTITPSIVGTTTLAFNNRGMPTNAVNFTLCPETRSGITTQGRTVALNTAGQPRIQSGARPACP